MLFPAWAFGSLNIPKIYCQIALLAQSDTTAITKVRAGKLDHAFSAQGSEKRACVQNMPLGSGECEDASFCQSLEAQNPCRLKTVPHTPT